MRFGTTVLASLMVAVTLLLSGTSHVATASTIATANILPDGTNPPLLGSSLGASMRFVRMTMPAGLANSAIASYAYIVTLPAGTTFGTNATTASAWAATTTGTGVVTATPTTVTVSGTTITFVIASTTAFVATDTLTISTSATGGGAVVFPTVTGTWSLGVGTAAAPTVAIDSGTFALAGVPLVATRSTGTISADGASTSIITLNVATAASTGGDLLSVITSVGVFSARTQAANSPAVSWSPDPNTAAVATTTGTAATTINASTNATLTLRSSAVGSASIRVYATPAGGGQAVLLTAVGVELTTPKAQPGSTAAISVRPAALSVGRSATQSVTVDLRDASGNTVIEGTGVTITTNIGTFSSCPLGTSGSGLCVTYVPTGGIVTVSIAGSGLAGIQTIRATVTGGTVSGIATVVLYGPATTLEVSGRSSDSASSFVSKKTLSNVDVPSTAQDEILIAAVAKDANGAVVDSGNVTFTMTGPSGNTVVFTSTTAGQVPETGGITTSATACSVSGSGTSSCVDDIAAASSGASTPSHASAYINVNSRTGEPVGTYTVRATITGADDATITGTMTFTVVKSPASLTIGEVPTLAVGGRVPLSIMCRDTDGNVCPAGTLVGVNVSSVNLIAQNSLTGVAGASLSDAVTVDDGTVTVNLIGLAAGSTHVVASVGTLVAVKAVTVSDVPPPAAIPPSVVASGTFSGGAISPSGVSIVSFTGTTGQLNTAGAAANLVSVTATVGGKALTFVVGAPDFVNTEFNAAFPNGLNGVLVIVKA